MLLGCMQIICHFVWGEQLWIFVCWGVMEPIPHRNWELSAACSIIVPHLYTSILKVTNTVQTDHKNYLKNCGMDINISLLNYYNTDLISPPFRLGAKSKAKFDLIFYNIIRKLILLHCWYCQVISLVLNYFREVLNKWSHVCIFVVDFICPLISCLILLFRYVLEATVTLVTGKIHVICFS